jgi:hypothetical protein
MHMIVRAHLSRPLLSLKRWGVEIIGKDKRRSSCRENPGKPISFVVSSMSTPNHATGRDYELSQSNPHTHRLFPYDLF